TNLTTHYSLHERLKTRSLTFGIDRQLCRESSLVGGPRFATGHISCERWKFIEQARWSRPEQNRHHHQVTRTERAIEPLGIAEASGELAQSITDAILDRGNALPGP